MKRSGPLPRYTQLRSRGKRRFRDREDSAYQDYIRDLPCLIRQSPRTFGCSGPIEAAHVKSKGAGGTDRGNLIPLCHRHHVNQHTWGIRTFAEFYGLDLEAEARRLADQWAFLC